MTVLHFRQPDWPRPPLTALELSHENRALHASLRMLSAQVRAQSLLILGLIITTVAGWAIVGWMLEGK